MKKEEKGITLVALIITIIILLILAVVSIMAVTGTGLFAKTSDAVDKYENSRAKENNIIEGYINAIDNLKTEDSSQNYYFDFGHEDLFSFDTTTGELRKYYLDGDSFEYEIIENSSSNYSTEIYNSGTTNLEGLPSDIKNGDEIFVIDASSEYIYIVNKNTLYMNDSYIKANKVNANATVPIYHEDFKVQDVVKNATEHTN